MLFSTFAPGLLARCLVLCSTLLLAVPAAAQQIQAYAGGGVGDQSPDPYFAAPEGLELSGSSQTLVIDTGNHRVRELDIMGLWKTFAGTGLAGFSGDGGPATQARLKSPTGARFVEDAGLFVADTGNRRVRVIRDNVIRTFAGNGSATFSGDGGLATKAGIGAVRGLAADAAGNLYFGSPDHHRIRKVTPDGRISTFAGTGVAGHSGDGGPATAAQLDSPVDLEFRAGELYVLDRASRVVRVIAANGTIRTVAGVANGGAAGNGIPATQASLADPVDIDFDGDGKLVIAEAGSGRVRIVEGGLIKAYAGNGSLEDDPRQVTGEMGQFVVPASQIGLGRITAIGRAMSLMDANLVVANAQGRLRVIRFDRTVGKSFGPGVGDEGPAAQARYVGPTVAAVDAAGTWQPGWTLVVADQRLRGVKGDGTSVTFAGNGHFEAAPEDGFGQAFGTLTGVVSLGNFNYLAAEASSHRLRQFAWDRYDHFNESTTWAGTGVAGNSGDGGDRLEATFQSPAGLARRDDGTVYVSSGHRIRRIDPSGIVATHAGSDTAGFAGDGGKATGARLSSPGALALSADGALYFVDRGNRRIRRIDANGDIRTVAGNGGTGLSGLGGAATAAAIGDVNAIAFERHGRLVLTTAGHRVLMVDGNGVLRLLAGTGVAGYGGDGGPAADAQLRAPHGLALRADGALLVADKGNDRLRRLSPVAADGTEPPAVPPAPLADPGHEKVKLTLFPSSDDGGEPIIGYEVSSDPVGGVDSAAGSLELERTITGLADGVPVRFRVRAINLAGASAWSAPSEPVTPSTDFLPKLSIGDFEAAEGPFNTYVSMPVQVTLDRPAPVDLHFTLVLRPESQVDDMDGFNAGYENLLFAGETTTTVYVSVSGDDNFERDERVVIGAEIADEAAISVRDGTGYIRNDDVPPPLALRDDRMVVLENSETVHLDFRQNDLFNDEFGDGIRIAVPPQEGTAEVVQVSRPEGPQTRIAYTPPPDWTGEDRLQYEFCYEGAGCRRAEATFVVRPHAGLRLGMNFASSGFADAQMQNLRPLPTALFSMTPLVTPRATRSYTLSAAPDTGMDSYDPFLSGAEARAVEVWTIPPPADGQAKTWRIVTLLVPRSFDMHLYVGVDSNGNGQADAAEKACGWTIPGGEPCELELRQAPGQTLRYWTMVRYDSPYGDNAGADLQVFEVPMHDVGDADTVATGPGQVPNGEAFAMRVSWREQVPSKEPRVGFARVRAQAGAPEALVRVSVHRDQYAPSPQALVSGQAVRLRSRLNDDSRMYIDVPPGATRLELTSRDATGNVDFKLARMGFWDNTWAGIAPPDLSYVPTVTNTASGNETILLEAPVLTEGRWYVIPETADGETSVDYTLTATVHGSQAAQLPGSYYNPGRPGHGIFLYPAGGDWAGIWYTYLQDGTPTWYWLQGPKPGSNGVWRGDIYRAAWQGTRNILTIVGEATVTPGTADVPAFRYSYSLDGETGSEPMFQLGSGCPSLSGTNLDISTHWFNPARAGTGYSVQMWADYEFFAAFVYDQLGVPRYLAAERQGFGGADSDFGMYQTLGACPLCGAAGSLYRDVGVFGRTINPDGTMNVRVDATFTDGVPGAWSFDERVQTLGGPGTTQGCNVPKATSAPDVPRTGTTLREVRVHADAKAGGG